MTPETTERNEASAPIAESTPADTTSAVARLNPLLDDICHLPNPVAFDDEREETLAILNRLDATRRHTRSPDRDPDPDACHVVDELLGWCENARRQFGIEPNDRDSMAGRGTLGDSERWLANIDDYVGGLCYITVRTSVPLLTHDSVSDSYHLWPSIEFLYLANGDLRVRMKMGSNADSPLIDWATLTSFEGHKGSLQRELETLGERVDEAVDIATTTHLSFMEAATTIYTREGAGDDIISRHLSTPSDIVYNYRTRTLNREDDALDDLDKAKNTLSFLADHRGDL